MRYKCVISHELSILGEQTQRMRPEVCEFRSHASIMQFTGYIANCVQPMNIFNITKKCNIIKFHFVALPKAKILEISKLYKFNELHKSRLQYN